MYRITRRFAAPKPARREAGKQGLAGWRLPLKCSSMKFRSLFIEGECNQGPTISALMLRPLTSSVAGSKAVDHRRRSSGSR